MRRLSTLLLFGTALGAAALAPRLVPGADGVHPSEARASHRLVHRVRVERSDLRGAASDARHDERRPSCHHGN